MTQSFLTDNAGKVFKIITHLDRKNPILSKEIERSLDMSGPSVRAAIRELRRHGEPIVATEHGYFMATSAKEVDLIVKDLQNRLDSLGKTISAIKRKGYERFGRQSIFGFGSNGDQVQASKKSSGDGTPDDSPGQGKGRDLFLVQTNSGKSSSERLRRQRNVPGELQNNSLDDLL